MLKALERLIDGLEGAPDVDEFDLSALGELAPLVRRILGGASPRESLINLLKLVRAAPDWARPREGRALDALTAVLSSGPELTRQLVRHPVRLELLSDPMLGRAWSAEELSRTLDEHLTGVTDAATFAERMARCRNESIRLATGEFGLAPLEQVGRELSDLADLCLDRAISFAVADLAAAHGPPLASEGTPGPCGLVAMAMGKHGAQELNFCSDIDLVFIYATDEGQAGDLTLHEFFSRVCQQVTRLLSQPNAEGFTFRVDLRLRPEGSQGPICNSLAGIERYYETWGGPYDRLAWLKARPAAGDLALGEQVLRLLRPFVYPRIIRPEVVAQIQDLNRRIKRQQVEQHSAGWNVKLDEGGIREVEFFVQALQLLHAGKQVALQERATLRALDRLLFAGLISAEEHRQLAESYELWRHLEHRLQLHDGRQTHLLPASPEAHRQMALHLGLPVARFEEELATRRAEVGAIYATLSPASEEEVSEEEARLEPLLDPELSPAVARQILREAGFAEVERAAEGLVLLAAKPWGPLGRSRGARTSRLAPALLAEIVRSPDPDAALLHLIELTLRLGPYDGLWRLLEGSRPTLRLLISLLGFSDYLARLLLRHPDLLDHLLLGERTPQLLGASGMRRELETRLGGVAADDPEARLTVLGRWRGEQVLRIGLQDIAGDLELEEVWGELSDLGELILGEAYALALADAQRRYGEPRVAGGAPASMTILGLGKLGGRELTYASDLDLIFVYSGEGTTSGARTTDNGEFFARVAQRLIRSLSAALEEGSLYQVDTRLRPSGKQGTLVSSWEAFRAYHRTAQTWERQVLIKGRAVGGDLELGGEVERWIAGFLFSGEAPGEALRGEIRRLRQRMERELAEESGDFYNLKLGRGGLLDIDFLVQYLQLCHGGADTGLRARSTLAALEALGAAGQLEPKTATSLVRGYRFLRRIEGCLRLVRDRSAEHLPASARGLEVMARRLGYRGQGGVTAGARLLEEYREQTRAIREVYLRFFGEEE